MDGVGIGVRDPGVNPFFAARLPSLRSLFDGQLPSLRRHTLSSRNTLLFPLNATLGVAGLPQSGTGQTALFTGVNGARLIGKHFGPYPYSTLKPVLQEKNIFKLILEAGKQPYFANAFPQHFFDYAATHRSRLSVTTISCMMSGVSLCRENDLSAGRAVSADITNRGWPSLGHPGVSPIDPEVAGRRLVELAGEYDFVLFEYWKTDHAGHSMNRDEAIEVLELFDTMLHGILEAIDLTRISLLITSDHGNIEDLRTKSHTTNPVPLIMVGKKIRSSSRMLSSRSGLTIVPSLIFHLLNQGRRSSAEH
jgi:hypothetical protein